MTSNIELISMAKTLKIPNFDVLMKDELKNFTDIKYPLNLIIGSKNSNESDQFNHWTMVYVDNEQKIYYSSFGDIISLEVKDFLFKLDQRPILSSDFQIQTFTGPDSTSCGLYCILILYLINQGLKFEDIILEFV
jgi:hypothetical protein